MVNVVANGYFETMRIPLPAGRSFGPAERAGSPNAVVISRSIANRLFRGENPVGKRLVVDFGKPTTAEIVGVAGDVRAFGLDSDAPDTFYFPASQMTGFGSYLVTLVVRTTRDPGEITGVARAALAELDRDIPLGNVRMMADVVDASTSGRRFGTHLLEAFAGVALLLATIGLYGVLAHAVQQRARELGIRMALGARPGEVFTMVVRRGMALVALGAAIGLGGAFAATRLIERLLFGVGRGDPAVYTIVTLTLLAAGLAACLVPARRATRVDPMFALRGEQ
jgi:putative ABC transport system permease protein